MLDIRPGQLKRTSRLRLPTSNYARVAIVFIIGTALYHFLTFSAYFSQAPSRGGVNDVKLNVEEQTATADEGSRSSSSSSSIKAPPSAESSLQLQLIREENGFPTSAAHCSLSTMNDKAWEGAMCSMKNLCYNPKSKEFVFYRAIPEIAPPPDPMNLGKRTKFYPKVVESKLPLPRYEADMDETWILLEMDGTSTAKLEHFLRDDLFAWWLLAQHATWANEPTVLRPLATANSPPFTAAMKNWYSALPFAPLINVADLNKYDAPVCFPRLVMGLGSMTDHCWLPDHDFHEMKRPSMGVAVDAIPCATGRGPLYYRLREIMISRLSAARDVSIPEKPSTNVILFAEESEAGEFAALEEVVRKKFAGATVLRKCVSCLHPKEQMELVLGVAVYVTRPSGPQTLAAHMLRRGAGIVLLEKPPFTHTNFATWNNLAYVRARWVQAQDENEIIRAIGLELDKAEAFMK